MADYRFLTTWLLAADRRAVWDLLQDVPAWPGWWPGVEYATELESGDEHRVGSLYRVCWRSAIPYRVEFDFRVDEVDEPARMHGRASGDLEGTGTWRLFEEDGLAAVTYDWRVTTTKEWMNRLGPLPRPLFRWNHDYVMAAGGDALARKLGTALTVRG